MPEDFGQYASVFRFEKHLISGDVDPEAEEMVSGLIVTGPFVTNLPSNVQVPSDPHINPWVAVYSPQIAVRTGVGDIEQITLPFISDVKRLRAHAALEYQKRLWAASSLDSKSAFRPFILPNRPILNFEENAMGIATAVQNVWQYGDACTTDLTLRYIRQGREEAGFRFVTGGASMAMSYRNISSQNMPVVPQEGTSGIRILPAEENQSINIPEKAQGSVQAVNGVRLQDLSQDATNFIQELADCTGMDLKVTSTKRSKKANDDADGHEHSHHLTGDAVDIRLRDPSDPKKRLTEKQIKSIVTCAEKRGWFVQNEKDHLHLQKKSKLTDPSYLETDTAANRKAAAARKRQG